MLMLSKIKNSKLLSFSGPELHRWHHNLKSEIANHNYGNNLIIWDHVFKTFYWPKDKDEELKMLVFMGTWQII